MLITMIMLNLTMIIIVIVIVIVIVKHTYCFMGAMAACVFVRVGSHCLPT